MPGRWPAWAGRRRPSWRPLQEAVTIATRPVGRLLLGAGPPADAVPGEPGPEGPGRRRLQTRVAADARRPGAAAAGARSARAAAQASTRTAVPAVVIANGLSNFDYTVTIDKGSDDGIEVGQPVVTGSADVAAPGRPGRVSVTPISADVQLLIDRSFCGRRRAEHLGGDRPRRRARATRTSRCRHPDRRGVPAGRHAGVRVHGELRHRRPARPVSPRTS